MALFWQFYWTRELILTGDFQAVRPQTFIFGQILYTQTDVTKCISPILCIYACTKGNKHSVYRHKYNNEKERKLMTSELSIELVNLKMGIVEQLVGFIVLPLHHLFYRMDGPLVGCMVPQPPQYSD